MPLMKKWSQEELSVLIEVCQTNETTTEHAKTIFAML